MLEGLVWDDQIPISQQQLAATMPGQIQPLQQTMQPQVALNVPQQPQTLQQNIQQPQMGQQSQSQDQFQNQGQMTILTFI